MTPKLSAQSYREPAVLERELALLYRRTWHLVCLRRDVAEPNDYYLAQVGRKELFVQNMGGELRAFSNVCPHRYSALRTEERGRAELRCPYHLWSFDAAGIPTSVPHRRGRALAEYQTEATRLEAWSVEVVGEFVFVSLAPARSLRDYLGTLVPRLEAISRSLAEEVDSFTQDIAANWKIVAQNTLEFDHVFSVHAQGFATLVERPALVEAVETSAPHLSYRVAMRDDRPRRALEKRIQAIFDRAPLEKVPGYAHILLFPLTTFGTTDNRHVTIARYRPVAVDRTELRVRSFLLAIDDLSEVDMTLRRAAAEADAAFTRQLFDEDRAICEAVQRGLEQAPPWMSGVLLPGEQLVAHFQSYYLAALEDHARRNA